MEGKEKPKSSEKKQDKEGRFLLGAPTFEELADGRLRCVETGHELPPRDKEAYSQSKACRSSLIDAAVANRKPPLNMFRPDHLSKSKLVCELTGDTINKTEEHIWKHITGRRFQNKLEQKEAEKLASPKPVKKDSEQSKVKSMKRVAKVMKQSKKQATTEQGNNEKKDSTGNGSVEKRSETENRDSEEPDFWVPPVGSRWDFDAGKDRWDSCASSEEEPDDDEQATGKDDAESAELSMRSECMSIAVGPISFTSRKKKMKRSSESLSNGN